MTITKPQSIIFDLDGTIIDSADEIIFYLSETFKITGLINNIKLNREMIGPPIQEILKKIHPFINEEQLNKAITTFRNFYDNSNLTKSYLYEGIPQIFRNLKKLNIRMYIATNKPRIATLNVLGKFNIASYFTDFACFGDKNVDSKENAISEIVSRNNLNIKNLWMVGDANSDIESAKKFNIFTVAHAGGYTKIDKLKEASPNIIVKTMSELNEIIISFVKLDSF